MTLPKLIVCTGNKGKLEEFKQAFCHDPIHIEGIHEQQASYQDPDETGCTFEENAIIKVIHLPCLADTYYLSDDSGLEVRVLGGEPGIYSARYAGAHATSEQLCQKVLHRMGDAKDRHAQFVCVLALKNPQGDVYTTKGIVQGELIAGVQGNQGFGYDPIFRPYGYTQTFGQLSPSIKNSISHRSTALRQMMAYLKREGVIAL